MGIFKRKKQKALFDEFDDLDDDEFDDDDDEFDEDEFEDGDEELEELQEKNRLLEKENSKLASDISDISNAFYGENPFELKEYRVETTEPAKPQEVEEKKSEDPYDDDLPF